MKTTDKSLCPAAGRCGACALLNIPYEKQLEMKLREVKKLLSPFVRVEGIVGMEDPFHYRNKVHAVVGRDRGNHLITGTYQAGTHRIVPIQSCLLDCPGSDEIIADICGLASKFRLPAYDEDTGKGLLRHILIRQAHTTGKMMVTLVTGAMVFPGSREFVKQLLALHPEIETVVQNFNNKKTSMILGEKEKVLFGKGYIEDELCGHTFRISSRSFYQVNSVQTEKLYAKAIEFAALTGREMVMDAYCGIGTIGITASPFARGVIGVEQNPEAVRDARKNAQRSRLSNIFFEQADATRFMQKLAREKTHIDVLFMDPPRTGSTPEFLKAAAAMGPERIIYISCNPETLARDLETARAVGYEGRRAVLYDLFPFTNHIESCVLLERVSNRKKSPV